MSPKAILNPDHQPMPSILTAEAFEAELNQLCDDALSVEEDFEGKPYDAHAAAASYFLMNLPALTTRRRVQLYLACVARGMQLDLLDVAQSKQCAYIAQLALAAFGTQNEGPPATINRGGVR